MNKQKHTPGPWTIEENAIISANKWLIPPDKYGPGVRQKIIDLTGAMGGDNTDADARLISAAPDMLEALQAIVALSQDQGRANLPMCANMARAAIAKATGN